MRHEQSQRGDRDDREPRQARPASRHHDQRGEQRAERCADIAAGLKQRLREAVPAARGQPRDPRRLRMKDRRADADECRRQQEQPKVLREGQEQQSGQREQHAGRERDTACGRRSV